MIFPDPPHFGQVCSLLIAPKRVCCVVNTLPVPLQFVHISGLVPAFAPLPWQDGHSSFRLRDISFVQPFTAYSQVIFTDVLRFAPLIGPFEAPERLPPPKISPKKSPKISPISKPKPSKPPAPPPEVPSKAACPN